MTNFKPNQKVVYKGGIDKTRASVPEDFIEPKTDSVVETGEIYPYAYEHIAIKGFEYDRVGRKQYFSFKALRRLQYTSASMELATSFTETIERSDIITQPKEREVAK